MNWKKKLFLGGICISAFSLQAATYYVATTGSDSPGSGSSVQPYQTIQYAVNRAIAGDVILVAPGIYQAGENASTSVGNSRVVIEKNVTVRSTQGAQQTIIRGKKNSEAIPFGPLSMRCVYMTAGVLDGFTLADGYANTMACSFSTPDNPILNGGGVCVPMGNRTPQINNCIITGCSAYRGGGAYWGTLNNCTVVANTSMSGTPTSGGGVWSCTVNNSIVRFNKPDDFSIPDNSVDTSLFKFCCLPSLPLKTLHPLGIGTVRDGGGNITADPKFITGTVIPARGSPCINVGANIYASGERDAAGTARIVGGSVDIGAYEANFMPYQLTVVDGSGSGIYTNGDVVSISTTNAFAEWMTFIGWTGDTNTVANVLLSSTTLVMPPRATTVIANYQIDPIDQIINEALGIPLPIATSNVTVFSVNPAGASLYLGPVVDGDLAFFETVYTNAGTVVFSWNVSSEKDWDFLSFYVDDILQTQISGEVSGVVTQFVAGIGPHRLKWEYSKDDWPGSSAGEDRGEVGPILWIPDDLSAELAVPGPLAPPAFLQPGAPRPFPYGFQACFLDRNPPAGATNGLAVRLGGTNGVPLVADNQSTAVEVLLNGAGTLSFRCYTACEDGDKIVCSADGVEKFSMTGDKSRLGAAGWTNVVIEMLEPKAHVVRWAYIKNGARAVAQDAAWVDSVTWTRKTCTLTVRDGSGSGTYLVGDGVTIVATNVNALQVFEYWTGDIATVANVNSMTTTVFMAGDLVVQANYKIKYLLTVNGGTGSGAYFSGQVIPVDATNMVPGMVFDAWSGDTEYLSDPWRKDTTLVMPDRNISITALVKVEPYLVSLVNGWDAGSLPNAAHEGFGEPQGVYPPGAEVRIVANPAPLWKTFSGWTWANSLIPVMITDTNADVSSFIMPSNSVTLIANYRDQTDAEKLGEALTIRGQALVVTDFSTNGVVALSSGGIRYDDPVVKFGGPSVMRNESVMLTTTSFTGDGILRFWWRGDAEATRDGITVEVNGVAVTPFYSEKNTNTTDKVVWWLSSWQVLGATSITIRYSRDDSYLVNENYMLLDRVTWIPRPLVDTLDTDHVPNINQESDPCFIAHPKDETELHDFSGADGGVKWDLTENAIKLGCFGYQTNNQIAQVGFRPKYDPSRTSIYTWEWKSESEAEYDRLEFLLDLVPTNNFISGKGNVWTPGIFVLKSGYDRTTDLKESPIKDKAVTWPIFTFRYTKDASQSFLSDSTWVRNVSRVSTYGLFIAGGTNTMLVFPNPLFDSNPAVLSEVANGMIPVGTLVTIAANPAPSGMVFAAWSGQLGGVVVPGDASQTFTMPEQDILLVATYTAAADPVSVKPQIMTFTLNDTVVKPSQTGLFTVMAAFSTSKSIGMTFEGASAANYEVEWSPSLSGPDCVWSVIPFTSVEVVGSAPGGYSIWRIEATAPSDAQQGFFRLKRKE